MKCKVIRNPHTGKIQSVKAPNGNPSILYKNILKTLPDTIELDEWTRNALISNNIRDNSKEEIALAMWSKTNTPSFKKWFGDSKVVDKNGEPLMVFHGVVPKAFTYIPS